MYPKTFFEQTQAKVVSGHCFVLMPFAGQFQEVYEAIEQTLEGPELNLSCLRADEIFGGGHIIQDILENIAKAEIVIADVTSRNPNVFYELGIAHMVKDLEKVLILAQDIEEVPFDLRQFRCIVYHQSPEGISKLQTGLIATVKEISARSYRFSVRAGTTFKFPHWLLGRDRGFHSFEILELWSDVDAVKMHVRQHRRVLGQPAETVGDQGYGLMRGEQIKLAANLWNLILEDASQQEARFRVAHSPFP